MSVVKIVLTVVSLIVAISIAAVLVINPELPNSILLDEIFVVAMAGLGGGVYSIVHGKDDKKPPTAA